MGHDVQAMTNHQLNTSSIAMLAEDLANRLQVNVQYGYRDDVFIEGISEHTNKIIILGNEGKKNEKKWVLLDSNYLIKIKHPKKYVGKDNYILFDNEKCNNAKISILKYCFLPYIHYNPRWWSFCNHFNGEVANWSILNTFRENVHSIIQKLGGNAAVYYDDQGSSLEIIDAEYYSTFEKINSKMQKGFKADYLNVSQFMQQYNQLGKYAVEKTPLAFFDDFEDLE